MTKEEAAKKLGYFDVKHLERNLNNCPEFWEWWELIKELCANSDISITEE